MNEQELMESKPTNHHQQLSKEEMEGVQGGAAGRFPDRRLDFVGNLPGDQYHPDWPQAD